MFKSKEIDIKELFDSFYRNKKTVFTTAIAGSLLSGVFAFAAQKIWQGQFQIVLQQNNESPASSILQNNELAKIVGLSSSNEKEIETEIGILESPSILMEVYNLVKKEKEKKGINPYPKGFGKWKKENLDIDLKKNTSILNLSYNDTDKELVLKILNKISKVYQDYSGRNRRRDIQQRLEYSKDQIKIYKVKSDNSIADAQRFATQHDLVINFGDMQSSEEIPKIINIEAFRVKAANEIRLYEEYMTKLKDSNYASDQIIYFASTLPIFEEDPVLLRINEIDSKLARYNTLYKSSDRAISSLKNEKSNLVSLLKNKLEGILIAKKQDALSRVKSSERPSGVLIKYMQLIGNAARDKKTLDNLENQYRLLTLDKARNQDPWELITTPTLLPKPIFPRTKKLIGFGFIFGLSLGYIYGLYIDKRKDVVFNNLELKSLLNWPFLSELSTQIPESIENVLYLLINSQIFKENQKIGILFMDNDNASFFEKFKTLIKKNVVNNEVCFANDVKELSQFENLIILITINKTYKKDIYEIDHILKIQNKKVLGYIVIK